MARLAGEQTMARLSEDVCLVIGLGEWVLLLQSHWYAQVWERCLLVDFDLVCVTNVNRQLQGHAWDRWKAKGNVLAERLRLINPQANVRRITLFYEDRTSDMLLSGKRSAQLSTQSTASFKCRRTT